jgi:D-alanyl-D-alanine carboxypeptidase
VRKIIVIMSISIVITSFLYCESFDKGKMDDLFSVLDSNDLVMGNVSIYKDGMEVYNNSIGFADIENRLKITGETRFRIGSISKTFTAVIIIQMIEEGKLSYEAKLQEFFPQIPNAEDITIEQLLRHQSGIYNFTNDESYGQWMEDPVTKRELVEKIAAYESVFKPGEKGEYSNSNYVLLSYIAEIADDKEFSEILHSRIVEPLGLEFTYYGAKIDTEKNEAKSYNKTDKWTPAKETDMSIPAGAGAIVSNPYDINQLLSSLFAGKLISEESLSKMRHTERGMGMGMFKLPFYDKYAFGHTGGIDGFQSVAAYFPEEKLAVTYNTNGVTLPQNDILIGILSIYFGIDYDLPEPKEKIALSADLLNRYTGVYECPELPINITVFVKDDILWAQGDGQVALQLDAHDEYNFSFMPANIKLQFMPENRQMILLQSGQRFMFTKE